MLKLDVPNSYSSKIICILKHKIRCAYPAVTGYDAAKVLIKALREDKPTRLKLRDTLANASFEAEGADKHPIKFENYNRLKEDVELAKIVKSACSKLGYSFVPIEYKVNDIQKLNSSCQ